MGYAELRSLFCDAVCSLPAERTRQLPGDESPDPAYTQPDKPKESSQKVQVTPGQLHALFGGS